MHLSQRWLLKGIGDATLIGLLHVTPKTHLRVSDQPISELRRAQEPFFRHSNITIEPALHQNTCIWDRLTRALGLFHTFLGFTHNPVSTLLTVSWWKERLGCDGRGGVRAWCVAVMLLQAHQASESMWVECCIMKLVIGWLMIGYSYSLSRVEKERSVHQQVTWLDIQPSQKESVVPYKMKPLGYNIHSIWKWFVRHKGITIVIFIIYIYIDIDIDI